MSAPMLFVSVAQTFRPWMTLPDLEPWVERAWAITVAKVMGCDRVVAVYEGQPVAAWLVRGAYPSPNEVYSLSDGSTRPRTCLSLGDPVPIRPEMFAVPPMRRGVSVSETGVAEPLRVERDEDYVAWQDDDED